MDTTTVLSLFSGFCVGSVAAALILHWYFMNFNIPLSVEDYTILINALHYYKKAEKRGNFQQYTDERINKLRDHMASEFIIAFDKWQPLPRNAGL